MPMKGLFFVSLAVFLAASGLYGQALRGTVVGTVTDQAGAVIPGTTVTLVNDGTKFTRSVAR